VAVVAGGAAAAPAGQRCVYVVAAVTAAG